MWRDQECKPNRDVANNVCCRPEDVSSNCLHLLAGECPPGWRVARECCPAPYDKWVAPIEGIFNDPDQCRLDCIAKCLHPQVR